MEEARTGAAMNKRAWALVALHVLLFVYSFCGFFSKNAARQPFMSFEFCAFYAGMLAILVVYAIGWQQILKHLPLTLAFANKAVTVVWGIIWGAVFFGEAVTWQMIVGAAIVMAGLVLFGIADAEERADEKAAGKPGDGAVDRAGATAEGTASSTGAPEGGDA